MFPRHAAYPEIVMDESEATWILTGHPQSRRSRGGMKVRSSRPTRVVGLVAFGALLCGCSQTFGEQIREHRGCIGDAQIAPKEVDVCLRNTDGRRQNINICLVNDMVPDSNIRSLNDCV